MSEQEQVTIYHSPDADDAFMFYGLVSGAVRVPGYEFLHELADIQSLNERTQRGELETTAVSVHAYPYLEQEYSILRCGASMGGKDYGPRLIAKPGKQLSELRTIAIPGAQTSAALALRLWLPTIGISPRLEVVHFDRVQHAVANGEVDAGVLIHEGQLTFAREGFECLVDLGEWWWADTGLPLPLGVNVVRSKISAERLNAIYQALHGSIEYALDHRAEALQYALSYGRGLDRADADRFVGMYVNEYTRDIGAQGEESIRLFLKRGADAGIIPASTPRFVP